MKISKLRLLVPAVLIVLILVGWWALRPKITPEKFDPSAVTKFVWVAKGQSFKFERPISYHPWMPTIDNLQIQTKLDLLRNLSLQPKVVPNPAEVLVEVVMKAGSAPWQGKYAQGVFAWSEGPFKGQGADLGPEQRDIFEEGRFAFESLNWSWCASTPNEVQFEQNDINWRLIKNGANWRLKVQGKDKAVDQKEVEQWLRRACPVSFARYHDNSYSGLPVADGRLAALFGGMQSVWQFSGDWMLLSDQFAGRSADFLKVLREPQDGFQKPSTN